jgi:hypothetical protein
LLMTGRAAGLGRETLSTAFTFRKVRREKAVKPFWGVAFALRGGGLFGLKRDEQRESSKTTRATHRKSRLRVVGSIINSMSYASSSREERLMRDRRAHLFALFGRVAAIPSHRICICVCVRVSVSVVTPFLGVIGL